MALSVAGSDLYHFMKDFGEIEAHVNIAFLIAVFISMNKNYSI